jgi:hypothetical protein
MLDILSTFMPHGTRGDQGPIFKRVHPWGWTLSPRSEHFPLCSPLGVNTLYSIEAWKGKQRIFVPRGQLHPWGSKFATRGGIENRPQCTNIAVFVTNIFFQLRKLIRSRSVRLCTRVARFLLTQYTKTVHNIPNYHNFTKWPKSIPNGSKIFQMTTSYTNIFHSNAHPNIPKLDFFGFKIYHLAPFCALQHLLFCWICSKLGTLL